MGLKGSGPFFQRSMANKVLAGYVTRICEIYIDDVLLFGATEKVILVRLREKKRQRLGLKEVEYVSHSPKRSVFKSLTFHCQKRLANYFRDHVPNMTGMVQPLRKLMNMKEYKGSKKLTWTEEAKEAIHFCRVAVSNCQELYLLEDTATPIIQTDASDIIIDHQIRVIRFFSKSLVGSQLNLSAKEKECYGIYYGVKLFEDLLHNRYFISKTDNMNLTYINVTSTGKVLRWKLYLQDKY